jgi:hypothetical protein
MTVIKRDRRSTSQDLINAVDKLCDLLYDQKETEAIADLQHAVSQLKEAESGSQEQRKAVGRIVDAFEGDHELIAYTHQREGNQWTEVEELSQASSRVLSLARRMMR